MWKCELTRLLFLTLALSARRFAPHSASPYLLLHSVAVSQNSGHLVVTCDERGAARSEARERDVRQSTGCHFTPAFAPALSPHSISPPLVGSSAGSPDSTTPSWTNFSSCFMISFTICASSIVKLFLDKSLFNDPSWGATSSAFASNTHDDAIAVVSAVCQRFSTVTAPIESLTESLACDERR